MSSIPNRDRTAFESAVRSMEAEVTNIAVHLSIDGDVRLAYVTQIRAMADEIRARATRGKITWAQAAEEANGIRNTVMEIVRARSTPVGKAMAEALKREGRTLNELIARKTLELYGPSATFQRLSAAEQNAVYATIVKAAGKSNPRVTSAMRVASRAGRSLIVISIAISVYNVAQADDKVAATGREVAVTGAGIAGGIAGGALAGLACGPGAPVCVTIGAFVGGAIAAFGVDFFM